ncbi:MAG TPA: tetratricopeptide repeat protein [Streptosporangiaceae bacterium]|nr:tetratricopeptide repeat protein [Streptosporangiaceae bacterium]
MDSAPEMLRQFCADLRQLWVEAGGPGLRALSARAGLGKSQVGAILSGQIRYPPDWSVVRELVTSFGRYAGKLDRTGQLTVSTAVEGFWRPRYALLEHEFGRGTPPRTAGAQANRAAPARPPRWVIPHQLPATVRQFTGREPELATLTALTEEDGGAGGTVVISALSGTAGVGKTALAVHWAHRVAERFPDGQLYVNLRGFDPEQPMTADDALAGFLLALGVDARAIPAETDHRAARYRSLLAGRRVLVVLDNAGDTEQVRPLLPGTPGCLVVVTSRDSLAGLVARDGASRIDLDLLPLAEAVGLLRALIGGRVDADHAAAAALAAHCARLPLALRVAAELAVAHPTVPLRELTDELADHQRRLDLLDAGGDTRTAVRAVFSWSYQKLDPATARAFRLLGLHPGTDFDPYAIAALAGTTLESANRVLGTLSRAHLTQPVGPGRHGMHDLLRDYARHLTAGHDSDEERQTARTRLFDHYMDTAAAAMDTLFPAERHHLPGAAVPAASLTAPVTHPDAALLWLDSELANLVAVAAHAAAHGWPSHTTRLAGILFSYLDLRCSFREATAIFTCARDAARLTGDRAAEQTAVARLGYTDWWQSRHEQAAEHFQQSLALCHETGDRASEARTLNYLGLLYLTQCRYRQAAEHFRQSLARCRETGNRTGESFTLSNLGIADTRLGRYEQANDHQQQSLALSREIGFRHGEANALTGLGFVEWRQGRYQQAAGHQQQALAIFRETGDRDGEATATSWLGSVELAQGRYQQAFDLHRQALAIFREISDRNGETMALNALGEALLATGQPGSARTQYNSALTLAEELGKKYEQARALDGLARACQAEGDHNQAIRHWQKALSLYSALGVPEADEVHTHLVAAQTTADSR